MPNSRGAIATLLAERRASSSPPKSDNNVVLVKGGKPYFDHMLDMISRAQEVIHLQTYIFEEDETGNIITDALIKAAQRNVKVYVMVDGYASQKLNGEYKLKLREAGIQFRFFEPLFRSTNFYFGRRMHHKIFVIDSREALIGGLNISDRYNDVEHQRAWLDFALHVSGPIANDLCILCWKTWKGFPSKYVQAPCGPVAQPPPVEGAFFAPVRMVRNDWVRNKNEIATTYKYLLRTAKKRITIVCSYILLDRRIRKLLKNAVMRGVHIRIVSAGPSDVMIVKHAERWQYDWFLRNGIELYEFQPTVLHAKLAVCDDEWVTLGSFNLNNLSAYATLELNLNILSPEFAKMTLQTLDEIIEGECDRITVENHIKKRTYLAMFIQSVSHFMITAIFRLGTFYYRQRHSGK